MVSLGQNLFHSQWSLLTLKKKKPSLNHLYLEWSQGKLTNLNCSLRWQPWTWWRSCYTRTAPIQWNIKGVHVPSVLNCSTAQLLMLWTYPGLVVYVLGWMAKQAIWHEVEISISLKLWGILIGSLHSRNALTDPGKTWSLCAPSLKT